MFLRDCTNSTLSPELRFEVPSSSVCSIEHVSLPRFSYLLVVPHAWIIEYRIEPSRLNRALGWRGNVVAKIFRLKQVDHPRPRNRRISAFVQSTLAWGSRSSPSTTASAATSQSGGVRFRPPRTRRSARTSPRASRSREPHVASTKPGRLGGREPPPCRFEVRGVTEHRIHRVARRLRDRIDGRGIR